MLKSREPAEEIAFLRDVIARQRAEIERLHQEVLTLRGMHQGYRDEIVEHFREIERLQADNGYTANALGKAETEIKRLENELYVALSERNLQAVDIVLLRAAAEK